MGLARPGRTDRSALGNRCALNEIGVDMGQEDCIERDAREAASTDFLERVLFPTLESRLDRAFPVYGFRRDAQGRWIATRRPASLPDALRTSARLYGERRGLRGLDPRHAFLPWLRHECPTRASGPAQALGHALDGLMRASGIPIPDDLLRDAGYARVQRLLDLRECAWASLRAHATKGLSGDALARLVDHGFSEQALRDGAYAIGLHPGAASGDGPSDDVTHGASLCDGLKAQGYTAKEIHKAGLDRPDLDDRIMLGLRDAHGTLLELFVLDPAQRSLAVPLVDPGPRSELPSLYGLDVALAAKGGPEDLLLVREPLAALALHGRGVERVAALLAPSFNGTVWDDLAGAGVRGVRFLIPGVEAAVRRVAKTLPADQVRRIRLRSVPADCEMLDPELSLGRRASRIGAAVLEEELRRLPWRDPLTSETISMPEPELDVHARDGGPTPFNGHGAVSVPPSRPKKKPTDRTPAARSSHPTTSSLRADARGLGDASSYVCASSWTEDASPAPPESNLPDEGSAVQPSEAGASAEVACVAPAASDAFVETQPTTLAERRVVDLRDDESATPATRELASTSLPAVDRLQLTDRVALRCEDAEVAVDFVLQLCRGSLQADPSATIGFASGSTILAHVHQRLQQPEFEREAWNERLLVHEVDSTRSRVVFEDPVADVAADAGAGTVLRLESWSRAKLAWLFGCAEGDAVLEDPIDRLAREQRRFFTLSVNGRFVVELTHEGAQGVFVEDVSPYRF